MNHPFACVCLQCGTSIDCPRYSMAVLLPHKGVDVLLDGHVCEECAPKAIKHVTRHFGTKHFLPATAVV